MGPVKLFADGSLGSRTALLSRPYADDPDSKGIRIMEDEVIETLVKESDARGFQVVVHAIGDAAIDQVLRAFERVTSEHHNPLRHGVVHCEIMTEDLLDRIARNDITVLTQPVFLTHDVFFAETRLGRERARLVLPFASLEKRGIKTAYGTDCPVESMDPLEGIACAVLRLPPAGGPAYSSKEGFFPEERVDVYTAVDAYTAGSAFVTGEEDRKDSNKWRRQKPSVLSDRALLFFASKSLGHGMNKFT
jgi:predicted amidohydrolase YtcJ